MLDDHTLLTVTDLKQHTYCPRVFYYHSCLPDVRPTTFKMEAGIIIGEEEKARARRRTFHAYELGEDVKATRYFDVPATSETLGLTGIVDEVVEVFAPEPELIPVDYKLSRKMGFHFKLQLAAYAELLEATYHTPVKRGFLYSILNRRTEEVKLTKNLRRKLVTTIEDMHTTQQREAMPAPTKYTARCRSCEFRRFCNDV